MCRSGTMRGVKRNGGTARTMAAGKGTAKAGRSAKASEFTDKRWVITKMDGL